MAATCTKPGCRSYCMIGSDTCFSHSTDPAVQARKLEACRKGGLSTKPRKLDPVEAAIVNASKILSDLAAKPTKTAEDSKLVNAVAALIHDLTIATESKVLAEMRKGKL